MSRPTKKLTRMGRSTTHLQPVVQTMISTTQKKKKNLMQIEAKLKICSSLLLVPRVPCWGIFKWLSSSEAKEERGDRWSRAFLQRFLRTVLVEPLSARARCSGEVSVHDLLLLKTFLLAPDSRARFCRDSFTLWPSGEAFLHNWLRKIQGWLTKNTTFLLRDRMQEHRL